MVSAELRKKVPGTFMTFGGFIRFPGEDNSKKKETCFFSSVDQTFFVAKHFGKSSWKVTKAKMEHRQTCRSLIFKFLCRIRNMPSVSF